MPDKKIQLTVAGQSIVCNFGINYFYKYLKELTGIDLLVGLKDGQTIDILETTPLIYFAGYKAECSLNKKDILLTAEAFQDYVYSMDELGVAKMLEDFTKLINPEKTGE